MAPSTDSAHAGPVTYRRRIRVARFAHRVRREERCTAGASEHHRLGPSRITLAPDCAVRSDVMGGLSIGVVGCPRSTPVPLVRALVAARLGRVDERELRFTDDEPLVGWRLFRVRFGDHGFVLTAPLIHDPDFEWFPSRSITARC